MQDENRYSIDDLVGGSDCQDALHTLYHYLDGELTPERRQAIKRHLDQCSPCLHAFDFESELKALVARCCREQAPDHLRSRIADLIRHEASSDGSGLV